MQKPKASPKSVKTIKLEIGGREYSKAIELKGKLKARTWNELFFKLVELGEELPGELAVVSAGGERVADEAESLRGEILTYLDELTRPYERTPLEEVFDKERAAKIIHTGRIIKVLLRSAMKDIEEPHKK